ncbi:alpha/beta hydrolase [Actinosynnema sp. ALI-1.44]|uniref:alpha/beta hydrolase n=1 Tax=Actinosynnema sp. ALI-1.44 TaxID=1933779 RepID=UPI00097C7F28|nr:alpha/beta fold hydrolase [Actinosynnema sp. ALI-1.44]ONI70481.1 alpha/beta hydrolase [Actinosynnema sp. ALI-1.44]
MSLHTTNTSIRTLDGLYLDGTLVVPEAKSGRGVVFVHGGGVTREEGGFFTRLADGLGTAGVSTLRYDLRGHGESEGLQQEATLAAHLNDIRVAIARLRESTGVEAVSLLGASFGGGLCAYYAAKRPEELTRLVLLNPQLNYKDRYIDQKPHWANDHLNDDAALRLKETGYLSHSPTVKHGRAVLNEAFWIRPNLVLGEIEAPTLIVHGTADTFVSIDASRAAARQLRIEHELVEIEGAQHGFAVHDDPQYLNPQSQEWQAFVIQTVTGWILPSQADNTSS